MSKQNKPVKIASWPRIGLHSEQARAQLVKRCEDHSLDDEFVGCLGILYVSGLIGKSYLTKFKYNFRMTGAHLEPIPLQLGKPFLDLDGKAIKLGKHTLWGDDPTIPSSTLTIKTVISQTKHIGYWLNRYFSRTSTSWILSHLRTKNLISANYVWQQPLEKAAVEKHTLPPREAPSLRQEVEKFMSEVRAAISRLESQTRAVLARIESTSVPELRQITEDGHAHTDQFSYTTDDHHASFETESDDLIDLEGDFEIMTGVRVDSAVAKKENSYENRCTETAQVISSGIRPSQMFSSNERAAVDRWRICVTSTDEVLRRD